VASGYFHAARGYWMAAFRGLNQGGKGKTQVRVPASRISAPGAAKRDADAFAKELDRYCRLLETGLGGPDLEHALRLGAVSAEQAAALRSGQVALPRSARLTPPTIKDAALAHPSSQRDGWDQVKYLRHLQVFTTFLGSELLMDLTVERVLAWAAALRRQGLAWDTRRHHLLYVRRASRMAPSLGSLDVLAGLKLDRHDGRARDIPHWTLPVLMRGLGALEQLTDPRPAAALALTALLGLRPTELCRAQVADLDMTDGCLRVGGREAKNVASRRALPLPGRLVPILRIVTGGRPADAPLIQTASNRRRGPFSLDTISTWWAAEVSPHLKPALPPRAGRKSFATWAREAGLDPQHLEAWIGHRTAFFSAVSSRHYLAGYQMDALQPASNLLDAAMRLHDPVVTDEGETGILSESMSE
jgi:integrase